MGRQPGPERLERRAPDDGLVIQLRAGRRDLVIAVAVASATFAWRAGAQPIAAIASGLVSAAIAFAIHRGCHRRDSTKPPLSDLNLAERRARPW